jgi:hypothetical protein
VTVLALWRPVAHPSALRQKLFGFSGLQLGAGEAGTLHFELPVEKLAIAEASGDRAVRRYPAGGEAIAYFISDCPYKTKQTAGGVGNWE